MLVDQLSTAASDCGQNRFAGFVECVEGFLNRVDFTAFKQGFSALDADPGGNGVPMKMVAAAIHTEGGRASDETPSTVQALHHCILTRKSSDHCDGSGRYVAMTAKYSSFGEHPAESVMWRLPVTTFSVERE